MTVPAIGKQQGVKGLMDEARSSHERTARLIGYRGDQMLLIACDTQEELTRKPADCTPLDEHVLLRAGISAGAAQSHWN